MCAALLALLAALGTSPASDQVTAQSVSSIDTPYADDQIPSRTFADLFQEMSAPETSGEGRGAVAVASAPPSIPVVGGIPSGQPTTAALPPLAQTVTPLRPTLVVRGVDPAAVEQVGQVEGVSAAASAIIGELTVAVPGGSQTVTVAAVDPEAFRPLTPEITAGEPAVWERIVAGDAAFTHDSGNRLSVPLGTTVLTTPTIPSGAEEVAEDAAQVDDQLLGPAVDAESAPGPNGTPLRLGALASNGIPPVADALVSTDTGAAIGLTGTSEIYVALDEGADLAAIEQTLAELTGAEVEELVLPQSQTNTFGAFLVGSQAQNFFEPFDYIDHGDGLITIDSGWVGRNIASTNMMPVLNGTVTCHRQMLIQMYGALSEVQAAGLAPLIDTSQYGGCWVARHIDFNPFKPISMHGWGLAVDMNVSTNQLGAQPTMDPRIVAIFDRWGFVWGGRWSRPDGMHFELGAVIDVPVPDGFFR
ncbi:MAG: M15 family metallopeptidase [Euzebya sp.]